MSKPLLTPDDDGRKPGLTVGTITADKIVNGAIRTAPAGLPEVEPCGSCGGRINPVTGECGCSD